MTHPHFFRQLIGFFNTSFRAQLRTPTAIFFGFVLPVVFISIFAFFSINQEIALDVGVAKPVPQNIQFVIDELEDNPGYSVWIEDEKVLTEKLNNGELDVLLTFPNIRENTYRLTANARREVEAQIVMDHLTGLLDSYLLDQNGLSQDITIETDFTTVNDQDYIDFVLPGFLGFSIMSIAVSVTAFSFLTLKKTGALKRLFAAPTYTAAFILGQSGSRVVFGFLQNIFLISFAMVFFDFSPFHGLFGIWQVLVVVLLGLLVFMAVGYIIAGLAKNDEIASPLTNLVILPQFLLAGTFFPVEQFPVWLQSVAQSLPLYNFNQAIRLISIQGYHLWDTPVLTQIAFLIGWGLVLYFAASKTFRIR